MNEFMQSHTVTDCYVILDTRDEEIKVDRAFTDEQEAQEYLSRNPGFIKVTTPLVVLKLGHNK